MQMQPTFLNSVKWAYISKWGDKAFSSVFTIIFAAVLGPRDFGIITIAMVYIIFIQMFLEQGLKTALIQKKDLQPEHLDAVFWTNILLSFGLVGLSILFSRWWATLNHLPELPMIIAALSLIIPIEALSIVQNALLTRELDFKSLSIRSNAGVIAGGVFGIVMALSGFGVWSLVCQQVIRDSTSLFLLWRLSSWRPKFNFSWHHLRELLGFSGFNFIGQLGVFANGQAGVVLLGALFGPVAVGLYRLAERLMNTILNSAAGSIQSVSLPIFSRLQDKPSELRDSALACIRFSSTITFPALAGLAAVSAPLMATLGPNWVPASNVLKILSMSGIAMVFAIFTGPLLQAISMPRQFAVLEWTRTLVTIGILIGAAILVRDATTERQIVGIALANLVTGAVFVTPVFLYILIRICRITIRELVSSIAPSAIAAATVVGAVMLFDSIGLLGNYPVYISLVADVIVGGCVGLTVLFTIDTKMRSSIIDLFLRYFLKKPVLKDFM